MDKLCRLCCSMKFVRNDIFDDSTDLYNKIALFMPIEVFKNDELPQQICDMCSCKINDLFHFCNKAIDIQNRLKAVLEATGGQLAGDTTILQILQSDDKEIIQNGADPPSCRCDQSTQTEDLQGGDEIKQEFEEYPTSLKNGNSESDMDVTPAPITYHRESDSDNMCLKELQKKKKQKKGEKITRKRGRPKKKANNVVSDGLVVTKLEPLTSSSSGEEWVPNEDENNINTYEMEVLKSDRKRNLTKLYYCCVCEGRCRTRSDLLQHYKAHEEALTEKEPPAPPPPPPPPGDEPLRCQRCKTTVASEEWASHWARHWARDRRPLRCRLCERSFARAIDVMNHGLSHGAEERGGVKTAPGRDLMCDCCSETFTIMRQLLAHRTRVHPDSLTAPLGLRCARCGRRFAHANSLRRHLASHEGRRDFLCYICGKSLSSKEHLKYHMRIHTGYKPHVCQACGKGFAKKCNLTLHERVHTGEKPHACPVCRKTFSQRSTLTIHKRYHSGERPYSCSLCGRGFVARGLLSMHLKTACV